MNLVEVISDSFADVRAHTGRTVLQTLGVVLGVASVVGTMGLTAGERAQAMRYWSQTGGVRKCMVWPERSETIHTSARAQASKGLTLDDVEAVRASIPGFDLVVPTIETTKLVRSTRAMKSYEVTGISPPYRDIHELIVERGRFITDEDVTSSSAVVVLGADRAREFFGTGDPVGATLRLGDDSYRVVGVMLYREFYWNKSDNDNALEWMNELIVVPVTSLQARDIGAGSRQINQIGLRLASLDHFEDTVKSLRRLLANRHGVEDFRVWSRRERMDQMNQQGQVYNITFTACGIISLLVGGIVVANILLASFTERMREVGVRKALGAKGWHIAVQCLVESLIVTGVGGAVGLVLGVGFVHGIAALLQQDAVLTPGMVVAAFASASGVAVLFGVFPAVKAARLDPVVALRYE